MNDNRFVVAIDGPAASGKGTLAKKLAEHFDLPYLDTGTLYRAVGYNLLTNNQDPSNVEHAIASTKNLSVSDVGDEHLYDKGVGAAASIVSAIAEVREALIDVQKEFANDPKGAVLDGRDIGTVICPEADFKFFISASLDTRAMRRYKQLQERGKTVIYDSVYEDIKRRDERDSKRDIAPLRPASDALSIDTSDLKVDDVFKKVVKIIEKGTS